MGGVEHGEPYDVGLVIDYVIQPQQGEVLGEGEERISWVSDMYEISETETETESETEYTVHFCLLHLLWQCKHMSPISIKLFELNEERERGQ
jgi:hypothetical protein